MPQQNANTFYFCNNHLRELTATLACIAENGQQEKTPKSMTVLRNRRLFAENGCFSASTACNLMYKYTVRGDFKYCFEPNSDFGAQLGHSLSRSKRQLGEYIGPIWEMPYVQVGKF